MIREIKTVFATEAFDENVGIGLADVICPICLDNYDNPKTLNCGHSLCHNHLSDLTAKGLSFLIYVENLKIAETNLNVVRCPICRGPSYGYLPTNYALRDNSLLLFS